MQTPPSGSISSSRRCGTHEVSPRPTRTCWDRSGGRAGERALDFLFFKPFFALLSPLLSFSRPRPFLFPSIFQTMDRPTYQPTNPPTNQSTNQPKPKNQKTKSLLFHRIKPVFVFDGATPLLKQSTLARRRARRERADVHQVTLALWSLMPRPVSLSWGRTTCSLISV